jgi:DNA invertase Pin-like site-specific DNA recombinase
VSAVSITARLPWERAEGKVQSWHRDRLAAVYVRQSTAAQVQDHSESTRLQYGLAGRAVTLGWAPSRVLVIDEDLGHSASGADARPGFARLVAEVGLDHVGIVLGIEMSRLARSGREWHQLLELCALSGALLGDLDGVYDPAEHNDRLLLGLKGTISEAELHLIRQRMWSGRIAKARRGELAVPLPAGFARRPSGEVVLDPDEQVRAVVGLVFDLFERLGTIGAVLGFLADTASSWGCGCGRDLGAASWPGAGPAGSPSRTCCATRPMLASTPMAAAHWIPGGADRGGRAPAGSGSGGMAGWSSCPGCCPLISASSSTSGTCSD